MNLYDTCNQFDGEHLLRRRHAVARHGATCEIDQEATVEASRKIVDDIVREKRVVYGYNWTAPLRTRQHLTRRYDSTAGKPNPYALFRFGDPLYLKMQSVRLC